MSPIVLICLYVWLVLVGLPAVMEVDAIETERRIANAAAEEVGL